MKDVCHGDMVDEALQKVRGRARSERGFDSSGNQIKFVPLKSEPRFRSSFFSFAQARRVDERRE